MKGERTWCREQCGKGHTWLWLFEEGMPLGRQWPCGCNTGMATVVVEEWPEGCLKVEDDRELKEIRR